MGTFLPVQPLHLVCIELSGGKEFRFFRTQVGDIIHPLQSPWWLCHSRGDRASSMRWLSLRACFLLGFAVGMPVLALPPVAQKIDDLLYGPPPADFGLPPAISEETQVPTPPIPHVKRGHSATVAPSMGVESTHLKGVSTDANTPQLSPVPQFGAVASGENVSLREPSIPPGLPDPSWEATLARLQIIRHRLEGLGADYVLVESQEEGAYRCYCQIRIAAHSPYTRPFEALASDPVAAGEAVLRQVEQWRQAGTRHVPEPQH